MDDYSYYLLLEAAFECVVAYAKELDLSCRDFWQLWDNYYAEYQLDRRVEGKE